MRATSTAPVPAGDEGRNDQVGAGSDFIVANSADSVPEFFRYSYGVLVRGKSVRRHLYFNLPAAERSVRRARARGDVAELILVELVPVVGKVAPVGGEARD